MCDNEDTDHSAPKRLRSSEAQQFDFRKHCLFCPAVSVCPLTSEYDAKIPMERRKRAFQIRSNVKADGIEYKQYILDIRGMKNLVRLYKKGYSVQWEICMLQMHAATNRAEPVSWLHVVLNMVVIMGVSRQMI